MNKVWMAVIAVVVCIVIIVGSCVAWGVGVLNREARLRVAITAKMKDNESEFDNMYKKISQTAQVSQKQMDTLKEIFAEHAQARTGANKGGSLANWIKESVPNVDTKTFENLQNIITASRDAWTMRQKELVGLKEAHDYMFENIPQCWVVSGRQSMRPEITIITSTRSKTAMETGKDDDISVFQE